MKLKQIVFSLLVACSLPVEAKDVVWYNGSGAVSYSVQDKVAPVVDKALEMFAGDMLAVTGRRAVRSGGARIEVYQLDATTDKEFKRLSAQGLPIQQIILKKDAFYLGVKGGKIIIMGSNGRGTAYGVLELSRIAGVSPWVDWGDVKPARKRYLAMDERYATIQSPAVEYRGVFINDEDWSLRTWSKQVVEPHKAEGTMGPKTYRLIYQLLLRLRANTIWPAMHPGTRPFFSVKDNKACADSFSIVVGSSHCEPMLRNNVGEWNEHAQGKFNYKTNHKAIDNYWTERVKETANMEAIYTLGIRGIHDGEMEGAQTMEDKVSLLHRVIKQQRHIIAHNTQKKDVPQVFIPYKEVMDIYRHGLHVPQEVTMMWTDDNYGYLTQLPSASEKQRSGGNGVYYHLSYWGRPHDYLWLSTQQPGLVFHQMQKAYEARARRMWIANIHDPKVAAYQLSLFLDMAWNMEYVRKQGPEQHLLSWLQQQFGPEVGQRLLPVMKTFYLMTAQRKPEFMGWSQVEDYRKAPKDGLTAVTNSDFNAAAHGNELMRYLNDYKQLKNQVIAVEKLIPAELQDAFFAAVKYPVFAAAGMAQKHLQAQEARMIGKSDSFHHDEDALVSAVSSWNAYQEIIRLTDQYDAMGHGKWRGLMNMSPRQLPVFAKPVFPGELTAKEIQAYSAHEPDDEFEPLPVARIIAKNAVDYRQASGGAIPVPLLGHSNRAVELLAGSQLVYQFNAPHSGAAVLRIGLVPTHPLDNGDLRFEVAIDGQKQATLSIREEDRTDQWKQNVLRGQVVKSIPVNIGFGTHTLTIKAIDNNLIIDQWMLSDDKTQNFYLFPAKAY